MMLRIVGAAFIVASCTGFGIMLAWNCKAEEQTLRQLLDALNFMDCQLQYTMISLPELALSAASDGPVGKILTDFSAALETNRYQAPSECMDELLQSHIVPPVTRSLLSTLGRSLGCFDLEGQVKALRAVQSECELQLVKLMENKDVRIRNYQTLGICAGAALAILLI